MADIEALVAQMNQLTQQLTQSSAGQSPAELIEGLDAAQLKHMVDSLMQLAKTPPTTHQ